MSAIAGPGAVPPQSLVPADITPGSRWLSKVDGETVMIVMARKPFGNLAVKREDRMSFGECSMRSLLQNFTKLEGTSPQYVPQPQLPSVAACRAATGYRARRPRA